SAARTCSRPRSIRSRSSSSTTRVRRPTGSEGRAPPAVRHLLWPWLHCGHACSGFIRHPFERHSRRLRGRAPAAGGLARRGEPLPRPLLVRCPGGHPFLRRDLLRPGRSHGLWVLALGGLGHPATTTSLPVGVARDDATLLQAANDFGNAGYDGPEPPPGAP